MANDVEIIVEASVADALVKLDLVKHAVKDVGDAGGTTAKQLGDENNRSSLSSALRGLEGHLARFNGSGPFGLGFLQNRFRDVGLGVLKVSRYFADGANAAGAWISGVTQGIPVLEQMGAGLASVVEGLGSLVAILGPAAAGIGILVAAFLVLDTILNAVATTVGTVVAIFADLVAPVTLVTGLLGGLGVAFLIAAKSAFGQGGALGGQLKVLKNQFDNLTKTLVQDFMPVFRFLIDSAHSALTYLNQIAKLPLADAFRSLATTGVQAVSKFLGQIGTLLARPFRLAVQIAFGSGKGGNEVASAVAGLWKQFSDFLFGYTKTHPVRVGGKFLGITQTQVDGALQPFIDWFNRHHFEKQGRKIGREILAGLAPLAAPLGQFIVTVLEDAAKQAARDFVRLLGAAFHAVQGLNARMTQAIRTAIIDAARSAASAIVSALGAAWNRVSSIASAIWRRIGSVGRAAVMILVGIIAGPLVGAWAGVSGAIRGIVGLIHAAIGAVESLIGALQSAASFASSINPFHGGNTNPSTNPGAGSGRGLGSHGPNVVTTAANVAASLAPGIHLHAGASLVSVHGADLTNAAQRRVIGAQLGDEIVRRFNQQAGG